MGIFLAECVKKRKLCLFFSKKVRETRAGGEKETGREIHATYARKNWIPEYVYHYLRYSSFT